MVDKLNLTPKSNFATSEATSDKKLTAQEYNAVTNKIDEIIEEQVDNITRAKSSTSLVETKVYKKDDFLPTNFKLGVNLEEFGFGPHQPGTMGIDYFDVKDEVMDYWKQRGITQFRIPFLWERIQPVLNGALDPTNLAELKRIVDYAISIDCEVILDMHNYSQYKINGVDYQIGSAEVPTSAYIDAWLKLSELFGNNKYIQFCLMNEPVKITGNDAFTAKVWADITQELVNVLRANGYSNILQVSGVFYTGAHSWFSQGNAEAFENFKDPIDNFLIEVHQYNDDGKDGGGDQTVNSAIEANRNLVLFTDWCRRLGFKAHLGETNVKFDDELGLISLYNNFRFMQENADVWTSLNIWGAGGSWNANYKYSMYSKYKHPSYPNDPDNLKVMLDFRNRPDPNKDVLTYIDFINDKYYGIEDLTDVFSISRNSKGYARNKDGSFIRFDNDQLRISDQGLLVEPTRTNLVKPFNYDTLSLTYFVKENVDIEKGILSPDGKRTAINLIDTGSDTEHWVKLKTELTPNTSYAASIYVKYVDFDRAWINLQPISGSSAKEYDFHNPNNESGWKEWTRVKTTITAIDNDFLEYMGFGFQPTPTSSRGDQPDPYTGVGSKIGFWHPQIEDSATYSTSPIIGNALSNTRDMDDISIIGDTLENGIKNDCTIILELRDLPTESVDLDILSFDGTVVLKRNGNSSMETSLGGTLTTDIVGRNTLEGVYKKSVGLSINRTTGDVSIYQQGVDPVSGNAPISATTSVKLEPCGGYISKFQVINRALNATELKYYVNEDRSWKSDEPDMGVVANNRVATGVVNHGTDNAFGFRVKQTFGVDTSEVKAVFMGWFVDSTNMDQVIPNNYTIQELSLEYNNVVVPVEFHYRDNRSVTIVAGDDKIETKYISPLLFGVKKFSRDTDIIVKGRGTISASGSIPVMDVYEEDSDDNQFFFYNSSTVTLSSVDVTGNFTTSTGILNSIPKGLSPWIIGRPTNGLSPSYLAIGDDLTVGTGDTSRGSLGRGSINASMQNGDIDTFPCFNAGVSGVTSLEYVNGTRIFSVIAPLCNQAIDFSGSEDIGTDGLTNLTTLQTRTEALWDSLKTSGISKIHRIGLPSRTTSTDDWATDVNQTAVTGWGTGEVAETFNSWLQTKVTDNTVDSYIDTRRVLSSLADETKWFSPKTFNSDGNYPNYDGHSVLSLIIRNVLNVEKNFTSDVFSPINKSGLSAWFDPSDFDNTSYNVVGNTITQINDKSGNGHNLTQTVVADKPRITTAQINSLNTIDITGSQSLVTTSPTTWLNGKEYHIFGVVKCDVETGEDFFYGSDGSAVNGQSLSIGWNADGSTFTILDHENDEGTVTGLTKDNTPHIYLSSFLNTGSELYIDHDLVGTDANPSNPLASTTGFTIGNVLGKDFDGQVGEVIIITSKLTISDRYRITGYLAHKWGKTSTLPDNHPFKTEAPN